jgi:multidrug efflux pump subunit AcrA (membrane-fusion protein)
MKIIKAIIVLLILGSLVVTAFGCGKGSNSEASQTQTATVQRGNLVLNITAAGNLALSRTQDLTVDLFYPTGTKGTIGSVLVQEGDSVTEGEVLVTVDTDEWNNQLSLLEDQVTSKEQALIQAQINEKSAEQAVKNSQDSVTSQETAVLSAEINLDQAETSLATSISAIDDQAIISALQKAQTWWDYVTTTLKSSGLSAEDYELEYQQAKDKLTIAQTNYDNMLSGYNSQEVNLKKQQVEIAQRSLDAAKENVNDAQNDVTLKQLSLQLSQGNLQQAEQAVTDAQNDLTDAQSKSPEIKAPFDGFVTAVNVAGGDEVLKGTVAVTIADPTKFEADILVSEMDISNVKIGGDATVTADSLSGVSFPAKVTHISPTATIQSGVVNYTVKVELDTVPTVSQNQTATNPFSENTSGSQLPSMLQRAVDSGRMTQQQAEDFMKNGPSTDFTPPEGFTPSDNFTFPQGSSSFGSGSFGSQSGSQLPATTPQDVQLRQGLTVTVNIITASRTDVLLVPNGAVTTQGGQSTVKVITANGAEETRTVTTGLSDWQYTEITNGLSEGEKVVVSLATNTSSSSFGNGPGGIGFFGPAR